MDANRCFGWLRTSFCLIAYSIFNALTEFVNDDTNIAKQTTEYWTNKAKRIEITPIITVHSIWQHFEILLPFANTMHYPSRTEHMFQFCFPFTLLLSFFFGFFCLSDRFFSVSFSVCFFFSLALFAYKSPLPCDGVGLNTNIYIQFLNNAYDFGAYEKGRELLNGKRDEPINRKENKLQIRFIHCISQYLSQKCIFCCAENCLHICNCTTPCTVP